MIFRISLWVAASLVALWAQPFLAAEYERTGHWVFHSKAFAEAGDETWVSCVATTESVEGTELSLRLDPAADNAFEAVMTIGNDAWTIAPGAARVRLDIGADHWILPAQGNGGAVEVSWTGDAALLPLLEDLASSSFAGLISRDGAAVSQFSLRGSRGAIEAMKACLEAQIGRGIAEALEAETPASSTTPF